MSTVIRELVTLFGFEVDDGGVKRVNDAIDRLKDLALGATAAAVGAAAALVSMAHSAAEAGTEVHSVAERLAVTTDQVQTLGYAARLSDASIDDLQTGLRFLGRNAVEAARGEKAQAEAFSRIGVKADDANKKVKPTPILLAEIADKLKDIEDGGVLAERAMSLFGRGGIALVPLLRRGSEGIAELQQEARDLGYVMSEDSVAASKAMSDEFIRLGYAVRGLRNALGRAVFPILTQVIVALRRWLTANRAIIESRLIQFLEDAAIAGAAFVDTVGRLWRGFNALFEVLGGVHAALRGIAIVFALLTAVGVGGLAAALVALKINFIGFAAASLGYGAAILAIFALIYLVWDEIATELRGGETIIGRLKNSFLNDPLQGRDNWMTISLKATFRAASAVYHAVKLATAYAAFKLISATGSDDEGNQSLKDLNDAVGSLRSDFGGPNFTPAQTIEDNARKAARLAAPGKVNQGLNAYDFFGKANLPSQALSLPPVEVHNHIDARGNGSTAAHVAEAARHGTQQGLDAAIKKALDDRVRSATTAFSPAADQHVLRPGGG